MAHKCFISFKTEDMDYKKKIQEDMDIDMIDKSLDEPINSDDEDYTCDYYYAGFKDGYNQAICEAIDMLYDKLKVE